MGNLITGNISADCISGSFNLTNAIANSNGQELFDFMPSKFFMFISVTSQVVFYNPTVTNDNKVYVLGPNNSWRDESGAFVYKDGKYYGINWGSPESHIGTKVYYMVSR